MRLRPSRWMLERCSGEFGCDCPHFQPKAPRRTNKIVTGGSRLTRYKNGDNSPEARAANAAYMRAYRERKANGTA